MDWHPPASLSISQTLCEIHDSSSQSAMRFAFSRLSRVMESVIPIIPFGQVHELVYLLCPRSASVSRTLSELICFLSTKLQLVERAAVTTRRRKPGCVWVNLRTVSAWRNRSSGRGPACSGTAMTRTRARTVQRWHNSGRAETVRRTACWQLDMGRFYLTTTTAPPSPPRIASTTMTRTVTTTTTATPSPPMTSSSGHASATHSAQASGQAHHTGPMGTHARWCTTSAEAHRGRRYSGYEQTYSAGTVSVGRKI